MKKGKVLGKSQVIAVLMVLCLGGAVWLNMKFSSTSKYLGEATYVDSKKSTAVATCAKSETSDYFETVKKDRTKAQEEAEETVTELLKGDKLTDEEKAEAINLTKEIAKRIESANNIETLLVAKGFKQSVAVLTDKNANIVVKSDGLTTAQTIQIQDVVTSQTGINLANIKIVTVK